MSKGKEASPFADYIKANGEKKNKRHFYEYTHDSFSTTAKNTVLLFFKKSKSLLRMATFDVTCKHGFTHSRIAFSVDSRSSGAVPTSHPGTQ